MDHQTLILKIIEDVKDETGVITTEKTKKYQQVVNTESIHNVYVDYVQKEEEEDLDVTYHPSIK